MKLIQRKMYLDKLIELKESDLIKVMTGVRRCGKSTIFSQYIDYLHKNSTNKNQVFFMNFESYDAKKYLENPELLHNEVINRASNGKTLYVFFDEVQNLPDFQKIIDSLHLQSNIDLYITGSNAYLLSNELATLFAGRFIEIHVLPFSFQEYLMMFEKSERPDMLFQKYLSNGAMPGILNLPNEQTDKYLFDVFESAVRKDIIQRYSWHKNNRFDKTMQFMFDSIGSPLSINNIVNTFKSQSIFISAHTIEKYLNALTESYLFYKVQRFDAKGKNLLKTNEKYYTVDIGFSNTLLGRLENSNLGHRLENIVYLELLRRYKKVYTGKVGVNEVDFVVTSYAGRTEYFQVAYTAREESTLERELRPLQTISDFNQRTLLTLDLDPELSYNGIRKLNVVDWLLEG